ncbi:MAG: hypothetical protein HYY04_15030, partial [Chloroflexi bacterium]|nr:hypothetical protein [Chloroflexota bacterium]
MRAVLVIVFLAQFAVAAPAAAAPAPADWALPSGWFFTQTGGKSGGGFAVTDDGGIPFWTAFQRFGGVDAVGYPVSQRFAWDGFVVQAFQRVVFQWNPHDRAVYFVNVFDRLSGLGRDDWLRTVRQTPRPIAIDERGKGWAVIVRGRLALLDARPAMREKYFAVVGDAIQMNGLPTSAVADMGNHYALRAQRVVFQEWKEDVPWAKKGQVTVALGGDIAKEIGLFPTEATTPVIRYTHSVEGFSLLVPAHWTRQEGTSVARVILAGPIEGKGASPSISVRLEPKVQAANRDPAGRPMPGYTLLSTEPTTVAGLPATRRVYVLGSKYEYDAQVIEVTLVAGDQVYTINAAAARERFARHSPTFELALSSFRVGRGD